MSETPRERAGRVAYERAVDASEDLPRAGTNYFDVAWDELGAENQELWRRAAAGAFDEGRAYEREQRNTKAINVHINPPGPNIQYVPVRARCPRCGQQ